MGYYPYGIKNLFPYIVYSREPNKIIEAITLSFSDSKINNNDLTLRDPNYNDLINNDKKFAYLEDFKSFESHSLLVEYLKSIPIFLNSFSIYQGEAKKEEQNGKLESIDYQMKRGMYVEGLFKGKKLLVVMLYSAEMNLRENPYLSYKYIKHPHPGNFFCIERAVEYLQIEVDYAIDYEAAIEN